MKVIIRRSVVIASTLLVGLIAFSATPSIADTPLSRIRSEKPEPKQNPSETIVKVESEEAAVVAPESATRSRIVAEPATRSRTVEEPKAAPATAFVATAYSLRGRTASGRMVSKGLIAADPRVLPLGSRVRLEVPGYHGEYLVADTGGLIKGKRIDIWIPSTREAMRFGRRTVKLTVLSYGAKRTRRTAKG